LKTRIRSKNQFWRNTGIRRFLYYIW